MRKLKDLDLCWRLVLHSKYQQYHACSSYLQKQILVLLSYCSSIKLYTCYSVERVVRPLKIKWLNSITDYIFVYMFTFCFINKNKGKRKYKTIIMSNLCYHQSLLKLATPDRHYFPYIQQKPTIASVTSFELTCTKMQKEVFRI